MIEAPANVVIADDNGTAWVEPERTPCCGCSGSTDPIKGCGASWLANGFGRRQTKIRVLNTIGSKVGDRVAIGISETILMKGALSIYGIPLVTMIGMALVGDVVMKGATHQDSFSLALGLVGLGMALVWLRFHPAQLANDRHYLPTILRQLATAKPLSNCPNKE
jgi:sigma-E factor negative regulatory protein RseC